MSSPTWQDRRFMFQSGKEVREPSRKTSVSSDKGADAPKTATSPTSSTSPTSTSTTSTSTTSTSTTSSSAGGGGPASGRRRSSASSQGGIFSSLLANRSGDEYTQRRQSWDDMKKPEGLSGFFSGLVNKPTEKK